MHRRTTSRSHSSRSQSHSHHISSDSFSSSSVTSHGIETIHLLLLIQISKPLSRYPMNQRVLHQTSAPIESKLTNQASDDEEKDREGDSVASLKIAQMDMLEYIKTRFGHQSHVKFGRLEDGAEYKVTIEDRASLDAGSEVRVRHKIVKRKVATYTKITEATERISTTLSNHTKSLRLDHLSIDETNVPKQLYTIGTSHKLHSLHLAYNTFLTIPIRIFDTFASTLITLNLSNNLLLHTLPSEISKLSSLQTLLLVDCTNLISLPLSLSKLKNTLQRLELFGCTSLAFPPHDIALKYGVATQQGGTRASIPAFLAYLLNPQSFLTYTADTSKSRDRRFSSTTNDTVPHIQRLYVSVPSMTMAWGDKYMEYELLIQCGERRWIVRRRYVQLRKFYTQLKKELPLGIALPPFPPSTWSFHALDDETTAQRRAMLNSFFVALCDEEHSDTLKLLEKPLIRSFLELDKFMTSDVYERESLTIPYFTPGGTTANKLESEKSQNKILA